MSSDKIAQSQELDKKIEEQSKKIEKLFRSGIDLSSHPFILQDKSKDEIYATSPFLNVQEKSEEIEIIFEALVSNAMEQKRLPQYLNTQLEQWKGEAQTVLDEYNSNVSELTQNLDLKNKKYREKIEQNSKLHEGIRDEIVRLVTELSKTGKEEVSFIRNAVINHLKRISDELGHKNRSLLDNTSADKPFDGDLWQDPSEMLTFEQLKDVFIVDQRDIINLRRNLLSEVCKLRNELEKEKLNYTLEKQTLEHDTFYFKQKYNAAVPELAKIKRKSIKMQKEKEQLADDLRKLNQLVAKELESKADFVKNCVTDSRFMEQRYSIKKKKVFEEKKFEILHLLSDILIETKFIYESILDSSKDVPSLEHFNNEMDFETTSLDEYWIQLQELLPQLLYLEELLNHFQEFWQELQLNQELLTKHQLLSTHQKDYKLLLQNFYKLEKQ